MMMIIIRAVLYLFPPPLLLVLNNSLHSSFVRRLGRNDGTRNSSRARPSRIMCFYTKWARWRSQIAMLNTHVPVVYRTTRMHSTSWMDNDLFTRFTRARASKMERRPECPEWEQSNRGEKVMEDWRFFRLQVNHLIISQPKLAMQTVTY
jgi:hypothetical protein